MLRTFVKLRELLDSSKELAAKLNSYDQAISGLITAIRAMMKAPEIKKRPIWLMTPEEKK